jgi:hypothetical protein
VYGTNVRVGSFSDLGPRQRGPFVPQQRTCGDRIGMSVSCQFRKSSRYRKAKPSGGLEVDDKLVLCWSLYWQIARLFTPEDAIDMTSRALGGMRDQTMLLP